ncbi:hypothetical protein TSUD_286350 [Trifolium subterraneum]|uniref:DDT domain-containing protein n=1 Tax=Trifolium subterraneum TaxID=3900 RepID=A0A2Z6NUJ0_TRISU|nr:hypothetical protein TSUD_286350 [Trifolium subterraneum]
MDLNSSPFKPNPTMDLNSSPSQLNQSNSDASCHQFREKTMDGQEPIDLPLHTAEASASIHSSSLSQSKSTEFSVKPNQTMDLNSSSFKPSPTMDLNSSPLQFNQSNVDANDTCHQFQETTMDAQEPTNLLVRTAEASAVSKLPSKKTTLKRSREKTTDGQEPIDLLVRTAEASAVSKLPSKKTTLKRDVVLGLSAFPIKVKSLGRPKALKIGHEKAKKYSQGTVVIVDGTGDNVGEESQINPTLLSAEKIVEEIPLPTGIQLKKILEFEFEPEDVGNALQFLEFCRVFGKALEFKKGEAGAILRSLTRKQNMRHVQNTLAIEFQVRLLSLVVSDSDMQPASITASNGKSSWLNVLKSLITESDRALKEFPLDWLNRGISGYYALDLSQKLILLNFICDEALGTKTLRKYIDDQHETFTEEKKAAKSKVADAKGKERNLKLRLQRETAKAVMSTELQDEKGKTVISTELQDQMAEAVISTEAQDEMAEAVMSTEAQDEMEEAEFCIFDENDGKQKMHTASFEANVPIGEIMGKNIAGFEAQETGVDCVLMMFKNVIVVLRLMNGKPLGFISFPLERSCLYMGRELTNRSSGVGCSMESDFYGRSQ